MSCDRSSHTHEIQEINSKLNGRISRFIQNFGTIASVKATWNASWATFYCCAYQPLSSSFCLHFLILYVLTIHYIADGSRLFVMAPDVSHARLLPKRVCMQTQIVFRCTKNSSDRLRSWSNPILRYTCGCFQRHEMMDISWIYKLCSTCWKSRCDNYIPIR